MSDQIIHKGQAFEFKVDPPDKHMFGEDWVSPFKLAIDQWATRIGKQTDDAFFAAADHTLGFDVDRDELMKALQYDRHQYHIGYRDGVIQMRTTARWVQEGEDESVCSRCGCYRPYDSIGLLMDGEYCPRCGALMVEEDEV